MKHICALALILCACFVCVAWSQPPTNSRPLEVPEGYVVTPFGHFHPSCVLMLRKVKYCWRMDASNTRMAR